MNAHFSDDILSTLLNEPIPGHGAFWSSAGGKSYPIPLRVLSFEQAFQTRDPEYKMPRANTFAEQLRARFSAAVATAVEKSSSKPVTTDHEEGGASGGEQTIPTTHSPGSAGVDSPMDVMETYAKAAIAKVAADNDFMGKLRATNGHPWMGVVKALEEALPDVIEDRNQAAYDLVVRFLNEVIGPQNMAWSSERRPKKSGNGTTVWVVVTSK